MSDLAATHCDSGRRGNDCGWLIFLILILCCCNNNGGGFLGGRDGFCDDGNDCTWIIFL